MASAKLVSILFRAIFLSMGVLNYLSYVFGIWGPISFNHPYCLFLLLIYHFFFIMTVWATVVTITADPGQVPLYWGFYIGDPDSKRSRYCLMCNVFKPLRCHHCSTCNRCVLNMDHHCPWINNCIGFYNKKYFMQMLLYLNLTLQFTIITNAYIVYDTVITLVEANELNGLMIVKKGSFIVLYLFDVIMGVILAMFFKFHIKMMMENKTTIENLDAKGKEFHSKYDKGKWENIYEVMGINKLLWFFPLKYYYGKPKGNGIDWGDIEEESNREEMQNAENNNEEGREQNNNNSLPPTGRNQNRNYNAPKINSNDTSQISSISRNNPGHSSMASLYDH